MIDQINKLIAVNLFLAFVAEEHCLNLNAFVDEQGNQLPGAKMLADIMEQKGLLKPHETKEFNYKLTPLGERLSESGGWLSHLEKNKSDNAKNQNQYNPPIKAGNTKAKWLIVLLILAAIGFLIVGCM